MIAGQAVNVTQAAGQPAPPVNLQIVVDP
jgi:hypothetical protein